MSNYLLHLPKNEEIENRQKALKELSDKLDWRQQCTASCITTNEKENTRSSLLNWAKRDLKKPSNLIRITAYKQEAGNIKKRKVNTNSAFGVVFSLVIWGIYIFSR